jgi:hypothetical protein
MSPALLHLVGGAGHLRKKKPPKNKQPLGKNNNQQSAQIPQQHSKKTHKQTKGWVARKTKQEER